MATNPKPPVPLTVQVARASWQATIILVVALSFLASKVGEDSQVANVVMFLLVVLFTGCSVVFSASGLGCAIFDKPNRTRLILHSLAGLVVPALLFVGLVIAVAIRMPGVEQNRQAVLEIERAIADPELKKLTFIEQHRYQVELFAWGAENSNGSQAKALNDLAAGMYSMTESLEAYDREWAAFIEAGQTAPSRMSSPELIAQQKERLAIAVEATHVYRARVVQLDGWLDDAIEKSGLSQRNRTYYRELLYTAPLRAADSMVANARDLEGMLGLLERTWGTWKVTGTKVRFAYAEDAAVWRQHAEAISTRESLKKKPV